MKKRNDLVVAGDRANDLVPEEFTSGIFGDLPFVQRRARPKQSILRRRRRR